MRSGWIICFKSGSKIAISEKKYKEWSKNNDKSDVELEEHWFDINQGMEKSNISTLYQTEREGRDWRSQII